MSIIPEEPADVVCLGVGYMSGVVAVELARAGYKVVGITKGPYWDYLSDFTQTKYDEWSVGLQRKFDHPLPMQTTTIRNSREHFALPVRRYTQPIQYHTLGHGVGGAAQHYGGQMGRQGPWGYQQYSRTVARYGLDFLNAVNPHSDLEDWPMSYEEYEPYYVAWEKAHGLCGEYNGSPTNSPTDQNFPWMSQKYPLKPHPETPVAQLFRDGATKLGYHPFPHVSSLASEPYTNQYGVPSNACVYDGYCGGACDYACETGAKANSAYRTIPAALKTGNLRLTLNSFIYRLDIDPGTGLVAAARYYDQHGKKHSQPGKVFFNGLWGYNLVRLMLLSGVGPPYDPVTATGTVGRGLTNGYDPYDGTSVTGLLPNLGFNMYPAGNAFGGAVGIYDLMDDNFDHTGLNFIGGHQLTLGIYPGGSPGNVRFAGMSNVDSMGHGYKAAQKDRYLKKMTYLSEDPQGTSVKPFTPDLPTTDHYIDVDPHYTDMFGDPITRMTYDWTPNPFNGATYLVKKVKEIFEAMGAAQVSIGPKIDPGLVHNDWWGHHLRGGCRIGKNAATSVWNRWNQCCTAPNFFGAGEITNTCGDTVPSGTHVAGPQSYVAAEGIKKYLQQPGSLLPS